MVVGASHAQFRPERRCRQPGALMDSGQSAEQRQEEAEERDSGRCFNRRERSGFWLFSPQVVVQPHQSGAGGSARRLIYRRRSRKGGDARGRCFD